MKRDDDSKENLFSEVVLTADQKRELLVCAVHRIGAYLKKNLHGLFALTSLINRLADS
jgi:hypothetical protein